MLTAKRISLFMIMLLAFATAFAQKGHSKPMMPKTETVYVCDHCNMADMKSGKCKMSKMKVKATVVYHCDHCNKDMAKGGACPMCHGKTTKMAVYYECDHCKTTSAKEGKCSKCKMEMTKHSVKMS